MAITTAQSTVKERGTINPFRSKGEVEAGFFCDREAELDELLKCLKGTRSVALAASRRYGKTWLARLALRKLQSEGILTAYIDLVYVHSRVQWIERLASAVLSSMSASPQELFKLCQDFLPSIGIESITAAPEGYRLRLRGTFNETEYARVADRVYDLPELIARESKKKVVVCIDEFPEIVSFVGAKVLARWKLQIQQAKNVNYLLASARPKMVADIFEVPKAPMGGLVKVVRLGKIPPERWEDFILDRFRRTKYDASREAVRELLKATQCYSYYTQMACRHLWNGKKDVRRIEVEDMRGLHDWILEHEDHFYEQGWRGLTHSRQSLLAALAADPGKQVFSSEFRLAHLLPTASTLQAALRYLEEEGLVERIENGYQVTDPFFAAWLKNKVH